MKLTIITFFIIIFINTCTTRPSFTPSPSPEPGSLEELIEREKIFLDYYGSKENQENAFTLLTHRCESNPNDAHSCYNLAVLKFYTDKKDEAFIYIKKANERNPNDPLYESMYRNLLIWKKESQNINLNPTKVLFTKFEIACKTQNTTEAFSLIKELVEQQIISKPMLDSHTISSCLNLEQKNELKKLAKGNFVDYSKEFYKEKSLSDPFSNFWDAEYLVRGKNIEELEEIKAPLALLWKEFRLAVKTSQNEKAKTLLKEFLSKLKTTKAPPLQLKAIERAAFFLIEQDNFFKNQRELLKEFEDKALR
jgi:tetratricopeptide (TPR) repeat protein